MECGVARGRFGFLPGGEPVEAITLSNPRGLAVRIITYGAAIQSLLAPDRDGRLDDVALGHAYLGPYLDHPQYFGATVGRVANRIAGGRFVLDGENYQVPVNDGVNSLHGGARGFDKANWEIAAIGEDDRPAVTLVHVSPDGDQGYPGRLTVSATYALEEDGALSLEYRATTDRTTIVNLSNHVYWNLGGEGDPEGAMGHVLTIPADHFLPTDASAIPTGEFRPVSGTAFDFRRPTPIGARVRDGADEQIRFGRGYDHCWVIAREVAPEPVQIAQLAHPGSGRVMRLFSNQPGLQVYSGNFLDGTTMGKAEALYRMGDAIVLEPQKFPDTANRPAFGSLRLEPGEAYCNSIIWRFSAA
jgi:aldose 1-epimerase